MNHLQDSAVSLEKFKSISSQVYITVECATYFWLPGLHEQLLSESLCSLFIHLDGILR